MTRERIELSQYINRINKNTIVRVYTDNNQLRRVQHPRKGWRHFIHLTNQKTLLACREEKENT